jgi:hypothetical protein
MTHTAVLDRYQAMAVITKNTTPGHLNNFTQPYRCTPYRELYPLSNRVRMDQDRQPSTVHQEKFKKMLCKYPVYVYGKSQILIARQQLSMELLWRQLHRDFLRFAN